MKYFSMFSGIGTGEKGIEQAYDNQYESAFTEQANSIGRRERTADIDRDGVLPSDDTPLRRSGAECAGFCEIDRHAEAIYRYHYPDHRNYGDATRIVSDELPDFDFLIAGFPCQAFSIAGKRQGFDDARGTLFFEIARILSHKRPAHFLLENVRGLLSHEGGKTVNSILGILAELDYFVELVVLNSKDYGVPQNRERCFFIGHLRERCEREILSIGNSYGEAFQAGYERAVSGTISTKNQSGQCNFDGSTTLILGKDGREKKRDYASCVTGGGHSGGNHSDMDLIAVGTLRTHKDGEGFREMQSDVSPTLNARARQDGSQQGVVALTERRTDEAKRIRREMRERGKDWSPRREKQLVARTDGVTNTVTATQTIEQTVTDFSRIRRLTPRECEALQGLPPDYTALGRYGDEIREIADTNRYKGLGNAFTVNVIEAIITKMLERGCLG